jgi:hypothetical protein
MILCLDFGATSAYDYDAEKIGKHFLETLPRILQKENGR